MTKLACTNYESKYMQMLQKRISGRVCKKSVFVAMNINILSLFMCMSSIINFAICVRLRVRICMRACGCEHGDYRVSSMLA